MIFSAASQAILLGLGAAIVWGISDFTGGFVTRRTFPALVVTLAHGLSLIAILIVLGFLRLHAPSELTICYGLLSGVTGGIGLMLFYEGLALGSMGLTAALAGVLTAVLPVLYSYFRNGHPSPAQLTGFALAAIAIWMIAYTPGDKPHPRGLGLATGAGIGFGLLLIFLQKAGTQSVAWAMVFSRTASTCIALTLTLWILARQRRRRPAGNSVNPRVPWSCIVPLAALAGALDTTGNLLYTLSSLRGRLDVAAVLSSLYPGFTILLAAWLLRERTTRAQTLGMILALVAVVLISF